MKTKEISFDTIQKIKANNKLSESLQKIEDITTEMYWNDLQLTELQVNPIKQYLEFDENSTDDFDSSQFIYAIMQFCEVNQRLLIDESKKLIQ